jgi:hypothetical protein
MIVARKEYYNHVDPETGWWERTWHERESLLVRTFGEMIPPDTVRAFYWDDVAIRVPGGCAMTFLVDCDNTVAYLTLGHGLTQPVSIREMNSAYAGRSGYGYEYGLLTRDISEWRFDVLYQLMTYIRQSGRNVEAGHRIPFSFFRAENGTQSVRLGRVSAPNRATSLNNPAAMMFWPYLRRPNELETSTGKFGILIGTLITEAELKLAKDTSTVHVMLLLFRSGVGQLSDPSRPSVTDTTDGANHWSDIKNLTIIEAERSLRKYTNLC